MWTWPPSSFPTTPEHLHTELLHRQSEWSHPVVGHLPAMLGYKCCLTMCVTRVAAPLFSFGLCVVYLPCDGKRYSWPFWKETASRNFNKDNLKHSVKFKMNQQHVLLLDWNQEVLLWFGHSLSCTSLTLIVSNSAAWKKTQIGDFNSLWHRIFHKKLYFYGEAHMYPSFAVSDILSWGNKNVTQAKKSPRGSLTVFGSSAKYHSESEGIC